MRGNLDAPAKMVVATATWMMSLAALIVLWARRPHTLLDLWLIVVMCVWIFDTALAAVLNHGRFDVGWYAGRIYGLLAASFVLVMLLIENGALYLRLARLNARERRRSTEELQASDQRFRRLFHEASVPLCFVSKDGVLVDRNARFVQMFGYTEVDVPILSEWWSKAYPDADYRTWVVDTWNAAVAEATRTGTDIAPVEYSVTCKSGEVRIVLISGIIMGEDFLATFFDVTERRKAEQAAHEVNVAALERQSQARLAALNQMEDANAARRTAEEAAASLRQSQERLQLLIDHVPAAFAMFDREMRYLAVSRRWMDDYLLDDRNVLGLSHYEIFPKISKHWKEIHRLGLAGETLHADEDRFERIDGTVQWLRWEVLPWRAADGGVGGIVVFSEDISRLVEARQEILQLNAGLERRVVERTAELTAANQELDAFAYAVSHDLRAPLRAMSGFSQALIEDYGTSLQDEARAYLDEIILASRHMGQLIDGLLSLSRNTRGVLRLDRVDISVLADRILEELAQAEPERSVEWRIEPGLSARGDARMIEVLLRNLLGNSWKYTVGRPAPLISVYAEQDGSENRFCVADNGAGFDMRHAVKLFQPFQRLHRQDEFPGIGIGLATVQRIVHRHGGTIRATAAPDKGATFSFSLPCAEEY